DGVLRDAEIGGLSVDEVRRVRERAVAAERDVEDVAEGRVDVDHAAVDEVNDDVARPRGALRARGSGRARGASRPCGALRSRDAGGPGRAGGALRPDRALRPRGPLRPG